MSVVPTSPASGGVPSAAAALGCPTRPQPAGTSTASGSLQYYVQMKNAVDVTRYALRNCVTRTSTERRS